MYTAGTVKMMCFPTEISGGGTVKTLGTRSSGEKGCFVLWQMSPGMWSLELVVGGNKVLAGSDSKIVWRHTPWLGTHAAKGPQRPLRRIIQVRPSVSIIYYYTPIHTVSTRAKHTHTHTLHFYCLHLSTNGNPARKPRPVWQTSISCICLNLYYSVCRICGKKF